MTPSQMYAGDYCRHHGQATRPVGRPGTAAERQQCDRCETEFQQALARLGAA